MKKTFISRQMELVFLSNKKNIFRKNIHEQLAETIAERKRILSGLLAPKDIHQQLLETIERLKRSMEAGRTRVIALHPVKPWNNAA